MRMNVCNIKKKYKSQADIGCGNIIIFLESEITSELLLFSFTLVFTPKLNICMGKNTVFLACVCTRVAEVNLLFSILSCINLRFVCAVNVLDF